MRSRRLQFQEELVFPVNYHQFSDFIWSSNWNKEVIYFRLFWLVSALTSLIMLNFNLSSALLYTDLHSIAKPKILFNPVFIFIYTTLPEITNFSM